MTAQMWNAFFCVGSTQIHFSLEKTTINSIKKHQRRRWQKLDCSLTEGNSCGDSDSDVGVAAAAVVVAEEMANAKQTVEADAKTQQSTIKKQKNGYDSSRCSQSD